MKSEYYVYVYLDPRKKGSFKYGEYEFDYEPFYIGKGKNDRIIFHLFESELNKYNRNRIKNNKIKKIKKVIGSDPICIKYSIDLSEQDALDLEKRMIDVIGRLSLCTGPLTNLTDGGDNPPSWKGKHHTEESKKIISQKHTGNLNHNYGKPLSDEHKSKISLSLLGKNKYSKTEEHKRKIAETIKRNGTSKGENNGRYGYHMTDYEKKVRSDKMIGRYAGDKHPLYGKSKYVYIISDPVREILFEPCTNIEMLKKLCLDEELNYKSLLTRLRENKNEYKGYHILKKLKENYHEQ